MVKGKHTQLYAESKIIANCEGLLASPENVLGTLQRVNDAVGLPQDRAMRQSYQCVGARAVEDLSLTQRGAVQRELATAWVEGFYTADRSTQTPVTLHIERIGPAPTA